MSVYESFKKFSQKVKRIDELYSDVLEANEDVDKIVFELKQMRIKDQIKYLRDCREKITEAYSLVKICMKKTPVLIKDCEQLLGKEQ